MKNKKILIILGIFLVIICCIGGTFAYWNWQTSSEQKTEVVFTLNKHFSCAADVGGNITPENVSLAPALCTSEKNAIKRELTVFPNIFGEMDVNLDLWLEINSLDTELSESTNFKYALTTSSNSCTTGVVSSGTFNGKVAGDTVELLRNTYTTTINETYYLYIWLDAAETSLETANKSFNFSLNGTCTDNQYSEPNAPVLDAGMIPVTISNDGTVTTVSTSNDDWYDYSNQEWANAVLVRESGTQTRDYYKNNTGKTVNQNDILAYYVWIPRYKYKIWTLTESSTGNEQTIDIVFESANASVTAGSKVDDYITHPAFVWDGSPVAGIWVGKFETGHSTLSSSTTNNNLGCTDENCANANGLIIKPNVVSLRYNSVSNQFYASRSMTRSTNPFGLNSSTTDSHMMKNSEWGAVAYLSHSQYGINSEIRINNNNSYTTGCGASTENGSSTSACQIAYGSGVTEYPQSTTGNITGVFDMSGGVWEYVMGNYGNIIGSSRFTTLPNSKYYDLYPSTQFTGDYNTNMGLCTLETCGGHALSETSGWYSDVQYFVDALNHWFHRGGNYSYGSKGGAFYAGRDSGGANGDHGFRSVVIVGT